MGYLLSFIGRVLNFRCREPVSISAMDKFMIFQISTLLVTIFYLIDIFFQASTPEDNNMVTSSEDKVSKAITLNASSQTITKVCMLFVFDLSVAKITVSSRSQRSQH